MLRFHAVLGLALSGAILVGCDKKKEEVLPAASPGATPTASAPAPSGPSSQTPGSSATPAGTAVIHPSTLPSLAPGSNPLTTTTPTGGDPQKLLTAAVADTADKKWDAAAADFKKLNAMDLTPQMKEAVSAAHERFVAAKTASGITLPGIGSPTTAPANEEPNK